MDTLPTELIVEIGRQAHLYTYGALLLTSHWIYSCLSFLKMSDFLECKTRSKKDGSIEHFYLYRGRRHYLYVQFSKDGTVLRSGRYLLGKLHGVYLINGPKGDPKHTQYYDHGIRVGEWVEITKGGQIKTQYFPESCTISRYNQSRLYQKEEIVGKNATIYNYRSDGTTDVYYQEDKKEKSWKKYRGDILEYERITQGKNTTEHNYLNQETIRRMGNIHRKTINYSSSSKIVTVSIEGGKKIKEFCITPEGPVLTSITTKLRDHEETLLYDSLGLRKVTTTPGKIVTSHYSNTHLYRKEVEKPNIHSLTIYCFAGEKKTKKRFYCDKVWLIKKKRDLGSVKKICQKEKWTTQRTFSDGSKYHKDDNRVTIVKDDRILTLNGIGREPSDSMLITSRGTCEYHYFQDEEVSGKGTDSSGETWEVTYYPNETLKSAYDEEAGLVVFYPSGLIQKLERKKDGVSLLREYSEDGQVVSHHQKAVTFPRWRPSEFWRLSW